MTNRQNATLHTIKAVLFDLDGTLVDTAKDFVRIIHELAVENNWQSPSDDMIREQVSAGSKAMVSLFDDADAKQVEQLRQEFLDRYEANICVDSELFAGLEALLAQLESQDIPWGIVTNKPRYLTVKLIEQLGLTNRCATLVCPDDVTNSKPDPEPINLAMRDIGLIKEEASSVIYIGDHIRDIQAGNSAGNLTIIAGYGYITTSEKQKLADWHADYSVQTSKELAELLQRLIKKHSLNTVNYKS